MESSLHSFHVIAVAEAHIKQDGNLELEQTGTILEMPGSKCYMAYWLTTAYNNAAELNGWPPIDDIDGENIIDGYELHSPDNKYLWKVEIR